MTISTSGLVKLNPKQEAFFIEYAKDFNGKQAAIRAGYSKKSAHEIASQLLKKFKPLLEEMKQERKAIARQVAVQHQVSLLNTESRGIATLTEALELVTLIAFADVRDLYDEHHNCKPIPELTRAQALMVQGFEVEETFTKVGDHAEHTGYIKKFKTADRARYLDMLIRHHGGYDVKGNGPPVPTRWDTSAWTKEDWESFKRLREKSKMQVIEAHAQRS